MNNTTFGDEGCGYYETICGGSGAVSCVDCNRRQWALAENRSILMCISIDLIATWTT